MRRYLVTGLVAAGVGLFTGSARAEVWLDVEPYAAAPTGSREEALRFVGELIERGFERGEEPTVDVRTEDGDIFVDEGLEGCPGDPVRVVVRQETWWRWAPGIQRQVLEELGRRWGLLVTAYHVRVAKAQNPHLQDEPLLSELQIDLAALPESFDAKYLLSRFVVVNAERETTWPGPNCWDAALAAVHNGPTEPRFVSAMEFSFELSRLFRQVGGPERIGDLVRLRDAQGNDIHAFTYLGRDLSLPGRRIGFTKNGEGPGAYLFMDAETIHSLYPDTELSYYRRLPSGECRFPF